MTSDDVCARNETFATRGAARNSMTDDDNIVVSRARVEVIAADLGEAEEAECDAHVLGESAHDNTREEFYVHELREDK